MVANRKKEICTIIQAKTMQNNCINQNWVGVIVNFILGKETMLKLPLDVRETF
ncbi:hypothetical protein NIES4102_26520 [Chondrocystis sp. NIES-4102]|nr:hypothetical protein NIES4102_26520 [Chondrocystis sp. NIES-4102]